MSVLVEKIKESAILMLDREYPKVFHNIPRFLKKSMNSEDLSRIYRICQTCYEDGATARPMYEKEDCECVRNEKQSDEEYDVFNISVKNYQEFQVSFDTESKNVFDVEF